MKHINKTSKFVSSLLLACAMTACGPQGGSDSQDPGVETPGVTPAPESPGAEQPGNGETQQPPVVGSVDDSGSGDSTSGGSTTGSPTPTSPPGDDSSTGTPTPTVTYKRTWFVSPTGKDTSAGTDAAPLKTISRAITLAGPGERILVRAGTYRERLLINGSVRAGTTDAPITLQGEGTPRLSLGSENGALLDVAKPNWIIRGFNLDLENRAAFAVAFTGNLQGTVLADSEIHNAHYSAGVSFHYSANGATLQNNHIHHIIIDGDDAHGVVVQPTARNITIRNNNIHDNSGDAIQCYSEDGSVPGAPADGVLIEGNDLYSNIEQSLDIKTCYNVTVRKNKMHHARVYPGRGGNGAMVVHMSAKNILIEDNDFYDSGVGIGVGGNRYGPLPSGVVIRRNLFHDMITDGGMTGGGLLMANSTGTQVYNNTFTRLTGPALTLGTGDGGPTENMVVKNNIIDAAYAVKLGSQAPGLKLDSNLYRTGAAFKYGSSSWNLSQWKSAQGQDGKSLESSTLFNNTTTFVPAAPAVDKGENLGLKYCGGAPDLGAVETGC